MLTMTTMGNMVLQRTSGAVTYQAIPVMVNFRMTIGLAVAKMSYHVYSLGEGMLTWEDAYYDNHGQHGPSENKWGSDIAGNSRDGQFSHDSIGLAVAKMSNHVYSLGEGIVGQVAITGKYLWISAEKHVTDSCSLFKDVDIGGCLP